MLDTGENPEAPQPREMIDLEVRKGVVYESDMNCNNVSCLCSGNVRKVGERTEGSES